MSKLESGVSSIFARYSALAINALGRQNLTYAKWNVVRMSTARATATAVGTSVTHSPFVSIPQEVAYNTSNTFYQVASFYV